MKNHYENEYKNKKSKKYLLQVFMCKTLMSFKSIVTFQIKTKNCHNVVTRSRLESKACYWHSRYWTIFLVLCMFPDAPVPKLLDHSGRCYTPITSRMIKNLGEDKLKAWLKSPTWCKGEGGAQLNLTNKLKKEGGTSQISTVDLSTNIYLAVQDHVILVLCQ